MLKHLSAKISKTLNILIFGGFQGLARGWEFGKKCREVSDIIQFVMDYYGC